ncbi:unnamed protein product [Effrenium voratum]|uniref:Uncharacterized protein n=1 Tax=Effrenium voratum TaxID=2562239 RepID=A0AA36HX25_9DINO|nr:unnamed protein product [Effrenium voratum]
MAAATTLILKMTTSMRYPELLAFLDRMCHLAVPPAVAPMAYDFVHMPWKKLVVVNFTSSEVLIRCIRFLHLVSEKAGIKSLRLAQHQGLALNVGLCSLRTRHGAQEPIVFLGGQQVSLAVACNQLLPPSLINKLLQAVDVDSNSNDSNADSESNSCTVDSCPAPGTGNRIIFDL